MSFPCRKFGKGEYGFWTILDKPLKATSPSGPFKNGISPLKRVRFVKLIHTPPPPQWPCSTFYLSRLHFWLLFCSEESYMVMKNKQSFSALIFPLLWTNHPSLPWIEPPYSQTRRHPLCQASSTSNLLADPQGKETMSEGAGSFKVQLKPQPTQTLNRPFSFFLWEHFFNILSAKG